MSTIEHALRATSDSLLAALDRLADLEDEKRTLLPTDPRLVEIAAEVEELAELIVLVSAEQRDLAEQARVQVVLGTPDAPGRSIEETPPRSIRTILGEWRAAERRATELDIELPESAELREQILLLRQEYRRAWDARQDPHPESTE